MVKSRLNPDIIYNEPLEKDAQPDSIDFDYKTRVYEINLFNEWTTMCLGRQRDEFINKDIIYYPLYLVVGDKVTKRIGVFELYLTNLPNYLDEENELILSELDPPLLYSFVNEDYIVIQFDDATDGKLKLADHIFYEDDEGDEILETNKPDVNFNPSEAKTWIEQFMKSNKYSIKDNDGSGDCLFHVITEGLEGAPGTKLNVKKLREILASQVTEDLVNEYKKLYQDYSKSIADSKKTIQALSEENEKIKTLIRSKGSIADKDKLLKRGKEMKKEFIQAKAEKQFGEQFSKELKFMKNINTVEDFKHIVQTCDFWAETWAISTLERILNIKLILFSEENFKVNDLNNVLLCGQLNDDFLKKKGFFKPKYYIMTSYSGDHYKLVLYDNKPRFSFQEIPYKVKNLIVQKCMESNAGPYQLIPKFIKLKESIKLKHGIVDSLPLSNDDSSNQDLYDSVPNVIFQFHGSAAPAKPGKGSGEVMEGRNQKDFALLSDAKSNWRRKISTHWDAPFDLDGHKWATVEHFIQGSKFKNNHPETYKDFSLDSNSKWNKDPKLALLAATEKGGGLREASIKPDRIYSSEQKKEDLLKAEKAKYDQHPELADILKATGRAKLMQYKRRAKPVEALELMKIRKDLQEKDK
jgi:predicted NAD-dependent protein-ADP-ribosyltransferase YbiA (DUF1768 family)